MKKIALLSCVMAIILSGCGNKSEDTETTQGSSVGQTTEIVTTEEEPQDTVPPEISCDADAFGCVIGQNVVFSDVATATDAVDGNIMVDVDDSEVNYDAVGEYSINLNAMDSAGNTVSVKKPCYVVRNSTDKEIQDCLNDIVNSNNGGFKNETVSNDDLRVYLKEKNSKSFMSDKKTDRRVFDVFTDSPDTVRNFMEDNYSGALMIVAGEIIVTNMNLGVKNLDSPWMSEFVIDVAYWTSDGSTVSDYDTVKFKSSNGEIVLDKNKIYGYGYVHNVDNFWGVEMYQRYFCFESEDEINTFFSLLNGSDVTAEVELSGELVEDFHLSEENIEHFKTAVSLYREISDSDMLCNISKQNKDDVILYPMGSSEGIATDGDAKKALLGENVTIDLTNQNVLLMDNDNITVKLKKVYQENHEVGITFSVTNNGNSDILINFDDPYIGDVGVKEIMRDGNSGPKPGKTRDYSYYIQNEDYTSLDSLKDICSLEGTLRASYYSDDNSFLNEDSKSFSISDYPDVEKAMKEKIDF